MPAAGFPPKFREALIRSKDLNDEERAAQTSAMGRAYAEGRLSLREVAAILAVEPSDAIALLEEHGFCRAVDVIRLAPEEQKAKLAKLREHRLSSSEADTSLVQRDVIASQRIEGVEARPWFRHR